jgi:hypothetical protein
MEWCVWMETGIIRMRTWGSFSWLNGPCSDERFSSKEVPGLHTYCEDNWLDLFPQHYTILHIYCPQLISHTMHFTAQYNITHYTLSNFHCGGTLHYISMTSDITLFYDLPAPSEISPLNTLGWRVASRTFHIVLQVENVLEVSVLSAGGMSNWYTYHAGYPKIVSGYSSHI